MKKGCDEVIYMLCQQNGVQIGELIFLAGSMEGLVLAIHDSSFNYKK